MQGLICLRSILEFEHGGVAQMENGWITPNANPNVNDLKCNIMGAKGTVLIDASNHNMLQIYTEEKATVPDVIVKNSIVGNPKSYAFESIRGFVDCIFVGGEFHVTMDEAARDTLVLLAIMEFAERRISVEVNYGELCATGFISF